LRGAWRSASDFRISGTGAAIGGRCSRVGGLGEVSGNIPSSALAAEAKGRPDASHAVEEDSGSVSHREESCVIDGPSNLGGRAGIMLTLKTVPCVRPLALPPLIKLLTEGRNKNVASLEVVSSTAGNIGLQTGAKMAVVVKGIKADRGAEEVDLS
jgi:hypothetical protein